MGATRLGALVSLEPHNRLPSRVRWGVALAPVVLYASAVLLAVLDSRWFDVLTREDGILEYAQVAVLVVCCALCYVLARHLWRGGDRTWALLYGMLGALMLVAAGEELSWGQRLLGIRTPTWYAEHNLQGETTLHNLGGVQSLQAPVIGGVLIVLGGLSLWRWSRAHRATLLSRRHYLFVPHPMLLPGWACGLVYIAVRLTVPSTTVDRLQEPGELILVAGVAVFLGHVRWLERGRASSSKRRKSVTHGGRAAVVAQSSRG